MRKWLTRKEKTQHRAERFGSRIQKAELQSN
jgi:hypothetical protein